MSTLPQEKSKKTDDVTELALQNMARSQREFENHELWQKLGVTPKEFFAKVNEYIEKKGIDKLVWKQKLAEAKAVIETRVREQKGIYQSVNFRALRGVRV